MKSEPFTGRSAEMKRESNWLSAEDLLGLGDVEVEISGVFFHKGATFDDGRKDDVYSLSFAGKARQLILNNGNRKTLANRFGGKCPDWVGKKITLYIKDGVRRPDGTKGPGIRIR